MYIYLPGNADRLLLWVKIAFKLSRHEQLYRYTCVHMETSCGGTLHLWIAFYCEVGMGPRDYVRGRQYRWGCTIGYLYKHPTSGLHPGVQN